MSATITNVYEFRGMNAEDMKASYKRLVRVYHPDVRKDVDAATATRDMQILNAEFSYWYAHAATNEVREDKKTRNPDKTTYYNNTYNDVFAGDLAAKIEELLSHAVYTHEGLTVELCGVFFWISGIILRDDAALRKIVKEELGFEFSRNKSAWFWTPTSRAGFKATNTTLDNIRKNYGSMKITGYRAIGD